MNRDELQEIEKVPASVPTSEERERLARTLPEGAVLAGRAAAWLHGVDPRSPLERSAPVPVECIVPAASSVTQRDGLRCHATTLDDEEIVEVAGLPCTDPVRTAADLFYWTPPHMALAVADALAARGQVSADFLYITLSRRSGDPFMRRACQLASWIEPRAESFAETWLRLRILDAGFPRPQAQIPVGPYRLDLGWPHRRLGIEYDGREFHSAPQADRRRREDLNAMHGWTVVGVGPGDVLGSRPDLERGLGELLGLEPRTRRRAW